MPTDDSHTQRGRDDDGSCYYSHSFRQAVCVLLLLLNDNVERQSRNKNSKLCSGGDSVCLSHSPSPTFPDSLLLSNH
jgi:hypothetical protein